MANLKEKIKNGGHIIGTMINVIDTLDIAKIFNACGYDYIVIDNEHGAMDYSKVSAMASLCNEMELGIVVRVPEPRREMILKYLDMGADGIMIPNCNNAEQAKTLVEHAKYLPAGNRGTSMMRGHNRYFKVEDPLTYMQQQNDRTLMMVQIESPEGVKNIDEILAVEGVDVAFVGPNDLSSSLGVMGQYNNPIYIDAVEKVIETAKRHNKYSGIQGMATPVLKEWIGKGMQVNLYSNEVTMLLGSTAAVNEIRTF